MKIFDKLLRKLALKPRKTLLTIASLLVLVGLPLSLAVAEFYPDRATYDYNKFDPTKPCTDPANAFGRCGSMTGPVFNSFINTPGYGDERTFLDAARTDQTAAGSFKNVLPDVTEGSKEVVLRMYIHNNANQTTNNTVGVAQNTTVRVDLPSAIGSSLRARGYISASNATPALVEDTVDLTDNRDFRVEFIPGSATLYNGTAFKSGKQLPDAIVAGGTLIGDDALDGQLPGCFDYEAVVQIRVKIIPKEFPEIDFYKQVSVAGQTEWGEKVDVKPGEKVKWLIGFANKGQVDLNNVTISDKLPPHLALVPGSVRYIDSAQTVAQQDGPLFTTGGIDFTTWKPNGGFFVRFETTALDDFEACEVNLRNIAYNDTDKTDKIEDAADVKITKNNCEQAQEPVYLCEQINKEHLEARKYRFTTDATAENGATIKQYRYEVVGNNNYKVEAISNQENGTYDHTFPGPGDYVVTVTVDFDVEGQGVKSDTGELCQTTINIPKDEEKCPIRGKENLPKNSPDCKEQPKTLPSTGPGDVVGMFVAVTAAAGLAHKFVWGRRYQ